MFPKVWLTIGQAALVLVMASLPPVKPQAITWTNVDQAIRLHMPSLCGNGFSTDCHPYIFLFLRHTTWITTANYSVSDVQNIDNYSYQAHALTNHFEAAIWLKCADISSTEPPLSVHLEEVLSRLLRILVVAKGDIGTTNEDLSAGLGSVLPCVTTWKQQAIIIHRNHVSTLYML